MLKSNLFAVAAATSIFSMGASAGTLIPVPLDSLPNGTTVTDQFKASLGLTISADNPNGPIDAAVTFDASIANGTNDADLEAGSDDTLLILQSNTGGTPNDEASNPAGTITMDFDSPISMFEFGLVDFEDVWPSSVAFYEAGDTPGVDTPLSEIGFELLPGIVIGDSLYNGLFTFDFGPATFDTVVFNIGESLAITAVSVEEMTMVPTPTAAGIGLVGLAALIGRRRRNA